MKVIFLLNLFLLSFFAKGDGLDEIKMAIDADQSFKLLSEKCPIELYKENTYSYSNHVDYCRSNSISCLKRCNEGQSNYCSSLANHMQNIGVNEVYSEALFSKSCQLGDVNACTNRASGLIKFNGDTSLNCAIETFELTCSKGDAWGCTMYGVFLAQGKGVERDLEKALEVLKVGCKNGIHDPACQNAKNISDQIKVFLSKDND